MSEPTFAAHRLARYLKVIELNDFPDAPFHVVFEVGAQKFRLTPYGCEDRDEADFRALCFCNALETFLALERPPVSFAGSFA